MSKTVESVNSILKIKDLHVDFPVQRGLGKRKEVHAVSGVTLAIHKGEIFGLVGESGCGKSTLANAVLGMVTPSSGEVIFKEQVVHKQTKKDLIALRRDMQMIFQDPFSSLNPRFSVYQILAEPLVIRGGYTKDDLSKRVYELLELVGLPKNSADRFPSDFSGGQRQRIGIARAIALNPEFLVCDEPVSALDVSVHAQILNLLMDLQKEMNMTYLFISHNLAVVKDICSRVAVMYLGKIVEIGETQEVYSNPKHPYTKSLISAVLDIDMDASHERILLKGEIPSPIDLPRGCGFYSRCPIKTKLCECQCPTLQPVSALHEVACFHID